MRTFLITLILFLFPINADDLQSILENLDDIQIENINQKKRTVSIRTADGKLITIPMDLFGGDESNAAVEKSILKRELFRAAHFSTDAINQNGAEEVIYDHLNEINYCHLWDEVLAKN